MYTIHADGKLLFDSHSEDANTLALSPKLVLDINKAGSLSFVLPPGNGMHGKLNKLKSIVTVEQDGVQVARGRVMETEGDFYNQQSVYCEGDKSFLMDSVFAPGSVSGTVQNFFRTLISNHNEQVDDDKQFTVGIIDAVDADEKMNPASRTETRVYWYTHSMIEDSLLNVYGGYLRTRTVDGTHYLDWVKQYGDENTQPIEFSVNMLDLTDKIDAGDVFTVLVPLGASEIGDDGNYTDPISIASVNGGKNYIQDDEAVAKYGKIWRTKAWSYVDDPASLLKLAREYLKTGIALETLTLKAVDMHFVDGNVQPIRIGDKVRILSDPHGLDRVMVCTHIEIDLHNPENTVYTFGEKPRTLTENVVKAEEEVNVLTGGGRGGGGGRSIKKEAEDIIRWAKIIADEERSTIALLAGKKYEEIDGSTSLQSVSLVLDGENGLVQTAVRKNDVISTINQTAEEIKISASKINLEGYVTASQLEAEIAKITKSYNETILTKTITATSGFFTNVSASTIKLGDRTFTWKSKTVQTGVPSFTTATITDANGNSRTVVTGWADAPSSYRSTIYYLGYD